MKSKKIFQPKILITLGLLFIFLFLGLVFKNFSVDIGSRAIFVHFVEPNRGNVREEVVFNKSNGTGLLVLNVRQSHSYIGIKDTVPIKNIRVLGSKGNVIKVLRLPFSTQKIIVPLTGVQDGHVTVMYDISGWGNKQNENYNYPYTVAATQVAQKVSLHQTFKYGFIKKGTCIDCQVKNLQQEVLYNFQDPDQTAALTEVVWNKDMVSLDSGGSNVANVLKVYWFDGIFLLILLLVLYRLYFNFKDRYEFKIKVREEVHQYN